MQPSHASPDDFRAIAQSARASVPPLVLRAEEPLARAVAHPTPGKPRLDELAAPGEVVYPTHLDDVADSGTPAAAQPAASCLVSTDQNCHGNPSCTPTVATSLDGIVSEIEDLRRLEDGNAQWLRDLDRAWAPRAQRRAKELRARAMELAAAEGVLVHHDARPGAWHNRRAAGLGRGFVARLATCGPAMVAAGKELREVPSMRVSCSCGQRDVPIACRQRWLCPTCQRRVYARMRARLTRAFKRRVLASEAAWQAHRQPVGRKRTPVLVTMTVRHSGDLLADRKSITDGWTKLRKWVHRRITDTWPDAAGKFDYAMVWEVTTGADGLGHVHAHAVVLWPFIDWTDVRTEWLRATKGRSSTIDLRVTDGKSGAQSARDASNYLAKYTSKGVNVGDFTPELAANVMDSLWQRRVCSTSRGFWKRAGVVEGTCACPKCKKPFVVVERPPSRRPPDEHLWDPSPFLRVELENGASEERWCVPSE